MEALRRQTIGLIVVALVILIIFLARYWHIL
jgi:hypothetical protein